MSSKKIFDMGKNLDDYKFGDSSIDSPFGVFTGKLLDTCKVNLNGDKIAEDAVFHGKFPKKRGRPPMTEEFWYDPDDPEGSIVDVHMGVDINVGDLVQHHTSNSFGYVTKIVSDTEVKIYWQITYKE